MARNEVAGSEADREILSEFCAQVQTLSQTFKKQCLGRKEGETVTGMLTVGPAGI